jgi:DNA mismatch repair protein MutL
MTVDEGPASREPRSGAVDDGAAAGDEAGTAGDADAGDAGGVVRRLDDATVERIAAGEVVTRPASVVTELVENALDAGASSVTVTVDGDGTERIRVADDGRGMRPDDAALAVEHHATSKLAPGGALSRVSTLGFRGEALASVAAVARLEVTTRAADAGPGGTRVRVVDGEVETEPAGRAPGTTVEVRDLFHNRPARRKSLAAARTEFARVSDAVTGYALVRPDVRFRLVHDGRETLVTPGSGSFVDSVLAVYGRDAASEGTEFDYEADLTVDGAGDADALPDPVPVSVDGLLCSPAVTRSTRDATRVAVNGRALADAAVRAAVVDGYGDLLPGGRYPVAVVRVSLPPAFVDANVHPAKREVAYRDADAVADAVEAAVRDALSTADLRRTGEVAMDLDATLRPTDRDSVLGDVTVIGQYRGLYLLCEADDLLVVDQHAAHERVNFERLRRAADGAVETREFDPPRTVSLTPAEGALVEAHADELGRLGFGVEPFGGRTVRLTRVPAPLGRPADADALRETLAALDGPGSVADRREELLRELACHPSLKAGDDLSREEAGALVERLGECETPYACPHGRPTVLSIAEASLAKGFQREGVRFD